MRSFGEVVNRAIVALVLTSNDEWLSPIPETEILHKQGTQPLTFLITATLQAGRSSRFKFVHYQPCLPADKVSAAMNSNRAQIAPCAMLPLVNDSVCVRYAVVRPCFSS